MEHSKVIQRFRSVFLKNGTNETDDNPFFRMANPQKLIFLTDLCGTFSYWTRIYLNNKLETLKAYHVPAHIIKFYQNYESNLSGNCLEMNIATLRILFQKNRNKREPRIWYESKKYFLFFYIVFIAVPVDRL